MNEKRGIWMAGKLAEEQKHTVGCEYLPNNRKVVVLKKSGGSESMHSENTAITPLITVSNEAKTRMNRGFAGGGAATSKPERLSAHDTKNCHAELVSASQTKIRHKLKSL